MDNMQGIVILGFILIAALWEVLSGRTSGGRKTSEDWKMGFLSGVMMVVVQRPLLLFVISVLLSAIYANGAGSLAWLEAEYFWPTLIGFYCIEEFLHGGSHLFAHARRPKNKLLARVQAFYKMNHRPHHLSGGSDNKGQLSVTHTFVNGWAWWLILPNYWFQLIALYLGLTEVFLVATLFKGLWAAHTHVNWNYDLYFHNHKWKWVRTTMWCLAHILTFPTQHHQHHARGKNSARNLTGTLAIYDWLIFKTLSIETTKPEVYGWRQNEQEQNVVKRYFNTDISKYLPASKN